MMDKAEQPTIARDELIDRLGQLLSELDYVVMSDNQRAEAIVDEYERHRTTSLAAQDGLVEALEHIVEYWNRDQNETAMADALWHIIETASDALSAIKEQHHD